MVSREMVIGGTVYALGYADGSPTTDEVMEHVRQIAERNQSALETLADSPVARQLLVDVGTDGGPSQALEEGMPRTRGDKANPPKLLPDRANRSGKTRTRGTGL